MVRGILEDIWWTLSAPIRHGPIAIGAPCPDELERRVNSKKDREAGDHEKAFMISACLSPAEWEEAGWKKIKGDWVKVRKGKSIRHITNWAADSSYNAGREKYISAHDIPDQEPLKQAAE